MVDPIETIVYELKYLDLAYNRLQIKTIPYREEKKRLEIEKYRLEKLDGSKLAKEANKAKRKDKASFERKLTKTYKGAENAVPLTISGKEDFITK